MNTRPQSMFERLLESLIAARWRDELFGGYLEKAPSLSRGQKVMRAADQLSFAIHYEVRRVLRTSRMFDPRALGVGIALFGFFAALYKSRDPRPTMNYPDFLYGIICGMAIVYWFAPPPHRSAVASGLLLVLLTIQLSLALLNAFPGHLTYLHFGTWALPVVVVSVVANGIERLWFP